MLLADMIPQYKIGRAQSDGLGSETALPASAAVSIATYLILYWGEIYNTMRSLPRQSKIRLASMLAVAGLSVATWRLSLSSLPSPAKGIIAVFVIWLPSIVFLIVARRRNVSVRKVVLQLLVIFTAGGLCTAEWRLADSVSIPTRVKAAVGPLIFLVPFHLVGVAGYLSRQMRKTRGSQDPTAGREWGCLRLIATGTTTGLTVVIWEFACECLACWCAGMHFFRFVMTVSSLRARPSCLSSQDMGRPAAG